MALGSHPSQLSTLLYTREHFILVPLRQEAPEYLWGPQRYKRGGQAAALVYTFTDPGCIQASDVCSRQEKRPLNLRNSPNTSIVLTAAEAKEGGTLALVPVSRVKE